MTEHKTIAAERLAKLREAQANTLAGVAVLAVIAVAVPLWSVAVICNLPNAILSALERRERKYAAWPQPKTKDNQ